MLEILFGVNALLAFFGWLAWNGIMFSVHKDEDEKNFNLKSYALEHYDNWLASLVVIPVLLIVGAKQLNINIEDVGNFEWKDCYYPLSGFIVEAIKVAWKKWRAKNPA